MSLYGARRQEATLGSDNIHRDRIIASGKAIEKGGTKVRGGERADSDSQGWYINTATFCQIVAKPAPLYHQFGLSLPLFEFANVTAQMP